MKIRGSEIYTACSQKHSHISEKEAFPCLSIYFLKKKEVLGVIPHFLLLFDATLLKEILWAHLWSLIFNMNLLQSLLIM